MYTGERYYKTSWNRRFTVLLGAAKSRGKNIVDIDHNYLIVQVKAQGYCCYYTGTKLNLDPSDRYDAVSIDRLDNSKGYIKGNVVITTWRINRAKANFTAREFIDMCANVVKYQSLVLAVNSFI